MRLAYLDQLHAWRRGQILGATRHFDPEPLRPTGASRCILERDNLVFKCCRCVRQRLTDVFILKLWVVQPNLVSGGVVTHDREDTPHRQPSPAHTRLAVQDRRIRSNTIKVQETASWGGSIACHPNQITRSSVERAPDHVADFRTAPTRFPTRGWRSRACRCRVCSHPSWTRTSRRGRRGTGC